jgi:hypothetical protein
MDQGELAVTGKIGLGGAFLPNYLETGMANGNM